MADTAYERVLCVKNEVQVYRIPPRTSNRGYRASDWKLDAPDWTGRLRVVALSNSLFIKLEDKNGELFAQCPVDSYPSVAVEAVMDSSRYFVIRIKDESGRSAFIGIGFHDRADSFDLNVSLQDHFKWIKQEAEEAKNAQAFDTGPKLDLGFKEGQTITINLGTKKGDAKPRPKAGGKGGGIGPLPPPPGGIRVPPPATSSQPLGDLKSSAPSSGTSSLSSDVDLLVGMDLPPQPVSQDNGQTNQNPPDLWGDFTGASGSQAAPSGNDGGDWIQF